MIPNVPQWQGLPSSAYVLTAEYHMIPVEQQSLKTAENYFFCLKIS